MLRTTQTSSYYYQLLLQSYDCFLVRQAERMLTHYSNTWYLYSDPSPCYFWVEALYRWETGPNFEQQQNTTRTKARKREKADVQTVTPWVSFATTCFTIPCSFSAYFIQHNSSNVTLKALLHFTALHLLELLFRTHTTEVAFTPFIFWMVTFKRCILKFIIGFVRLGSIIMSLSFRRNSSDEVVYRVTYTNYKLLRANMIFRQPFASFRPFQQYS